MLRGHGCKFHQLVHAAARALLEVGGHGKAARQVGIARSTLYRWTKEPRFRQVYEVVRRTRVAA
jgi:hypothetical protein